MEKKAQYLELVEYITGKSCGQPMSCIKPINKTHPKFVNKKKTHNPKS